MKKILLLIVLLLIGGGAFVLYSKPQTPTEQLIPASVPSEEMSDTITPKAIQEVTIEGSPFSFSLKEIRVKKGSTVRVTFTNVKGTHDWVIDEFNARTSQLAEGQSETIEFLADKVGSFEYYCSVGNHRAQGMKGTLVVEE